MLVPSFPFAGTHALTRARRGPAIVGMSATVRNLGSIAEWLGAAQFTSTFRPVKLTEYYVAADPAVRDMHTGSILRTLPGLGPNAPIDAKIIALAEEVTAQRASTLIFCSSRKQCEDMAQSLALSRPSSASLRRSVSSLNPFSQASEDNLAAKRADLYDELANAPHGIDDLIRTLVPHGVAYHISIYMNKKREKKN